MGADGPGTGDQSFGLPAVQPASVAARLRVLRERAGLSQEALAERAGLGISTLKALERDRRRRPHLHTLGLLAEGLGLSAAERAALLEFADQVPPQAADPASAPAGADTASARLVRLPMPSTALIGREVEVAEIRARLDPIGGSARLLTLVGPGGVGKTRLALEVAATLVETYADGTLFVDLASLHDPRLVPATIARALDLREGGGRSAREVLLEDLAERQILLVLDNFEHLLAAAPLLADLLAACPRLGLLVTSRAVLRLRGERRVAVEPLATPQDEVLSPDEIGASPSVRLFVERAQAITPAFALDAGNVPAVAAVCRRLDGMPLAIELAAAWAGLLGPEGLLRRLGHRLSLLAGGAPDLPERQQTLRQTLAWSYDLLEPADQTLLRRLAVFAGGWSLDAAEAVCSDADLPADAVLDRLQVLVDSSLVQRLDEPSGAYRLRLLETTREFALEQLEASGEAERIRARHAAYLLRLAEALVTELKHGGHPDAILPLGRELDNLRAALAWLADQPDQQPALHLAAMAAWVWSAEGQVAEGCDRLDRLLRAAPEPTPARAEALLGAAMLAWGQGDYQVQERLARESLAIARSHAEPEATAEALSTLGAAAFQRGEYATARELLLESLDLFRRLGRQLGIGWSLMRLASVARDQGQLDEAEQLYQEALVLRQAAGDRTGVAHILSNLSWLALYAGEYGRARALQEESLAIRRTTSNRREIALSLVVLARIALAQGARAAAWVPLREGLEQCQSFGDRWTIALALEVLAGLLATERPERALRLAAAASVLRAAIGRPVPPPERPLAEAWLAPAWGALGPAGEAAWQAGAGLSAEAALAAALAETVADRGAAPTGSIR